MYLDLKTQGMDGEVNANVFQRPYLRIISASRHEIVCSAGAKRTKKHDCGSPGLDGQAKERFDNSDRSSEG